MLKMLLGLCLFIFNTIDDSDTWFLSSSYLDALTVLASKISISKLSVVNLSFLNFAVVLSSLSFLSTETLSVELDEESFLDSSFCHHMPLKRVLTQIIVLILFHY